jgi:hypothetical protein
MESHFPHTTLSRGTTILAAAHSSSKIVRGSYRQPSGIFCCERGLESTEHLEHALFFYRKRENEGHRRIGSDLVMRAKSSRWLQNLTRPGTRAGMSGAPRQDEQATLPGRRPNRHETIWKQEKANRFGSSCVTIVRDGRCARTVNAASTIASEASWFIRYSRLRRNVGA